MDVHRTALQPLTAADKNRLEVQDPHSPLRLQQQDSGKDKAGLQIRPSKCSKLPQVHRWQGQPHMHREDSLGLFRCRLLLWCLRTIGDDLAWSPHFHHQQRLLRALSFLRQSQQQNNGLRSLFPDLRKRIVQDQIGREKHLLQFRHYELLLQPPE